MKIVRPYVKILTPISDPNGPRCGPIEDVWFEAMVKHAEYCSRVSHRSEDLIKEGSAEKLLKFIVMGKGDFSVIEHSMLTVEFLVDRGVTHELVRHRLFSFTQESTRFVNYEKKMPPSFIYPIVGLECERCLNGDKHTSLGTDYGWHEQQTDSDADFKCKYDISWLRSISSSEKEYRELVTKGWRPQEARSVFPNALASKITVTGNWRNWRHLMIMRTTKETHPQFKQVTIPLLKQLQENEYTGWLFEDIVPESSQAESLKKMR